MKTNAIRAAVFAHVRLAAAAACSLAASPALAQAQGEARMISTPADHFATAPGGVDMRTGRYVYEETDLSIGGEGGRLALTRTMTADVLGHANPLGNFSHNWDVMVTERRFSMNAANQSAVDYRMRVHFGGRSQTFEGAQSWIGYTHKSQGTGWASLAFAGDKASAGVIYTFTATDGTVAVFRPLGGGDCASSAFTTRCAYVSQITEPDGTMLTFDYGPSNGSSGGAVQLRRVTSSRGYALLLEGTGNIVTKACVLNLAYATIPGDGLCPANTLATASYGYTSAGGTRLASVTGPDNAVSSFTYNVTGAGGSMGFVRPGETAPWLTNSFSYWPDEDSLPQEIISGQTFADGQTYSYVFDTTPMVNGTSSIAGGGYQDALGHGTRVAYDWPLLHGDDPYLCLHPPCSAPPPDDFPTNYQMTPGPVAIVDPLGRTTSFDYCDPVPMQGLPSYEQNRCVVIPLQSFTDAEGALTELQYDGHRNITRVTRHARPGSNLADIVTLAVYDVTHPHSSSKPLSRTDANGNTTTYTYAPEHGGVLTQTGPAVNGIQPETRHEYAQRYVWIVSGGGYAQAATPIWLPTATSLCRTSGATGNPAAPCGTAGDEVRTVYDYGPDSGPNNLLLRGQTVTAFVNGVATTLRTCYGHDALGRRVSETQPNANPASCA